MTEPADPAGVLGEVAPDVGTLRAGLDRTGRARAAELPGSAPLPDARRDAEPGGVAAIATDWGAEPEREWFEGWPRGAWGGGRVLEA
jgi:hypothetical protein